jgi:hypothetical protein
LLLFPIKDAALSSITSPKASLAGVQLQRQLWLLFAVALPGSAGGCCGRWMYSLSCMSGCRGHLPWSAPNKAEEWSFSCCIPLSGCHAIIAYNGYGDILPASAWLADGRRCCAPCIAWWVLLQGHRPLRVVKLELLLLAAHSIAVLRRH